MTMSSSSNQSKALVTTVNDLATAVRDVQLGKTSTSPLTSFFLNVAPPAVGKLNVRDSEADKVPSPLREFFFCLLPSVIGYSHVLSVL